MTDPQSRSGQLLESFTKYFTVISGLAGAIWGLWLYLDHTHLQEKEKTEQLRLGNQKQQLELQQSQLLAETERERSRIMLEQQKHSLEQSKLTASTERDRGDVLLAQQKQTLEQSRQSSATELEKLRLSTRAAELETRLKQSQVKLAEQGRLTTKSDIDVKCNDDRETYVVTFHFLGTNSSSADVELTYTILYWFVGLPPPRDSSAGPNMTPINAPPIPALYIDMNTTSPINWKQKGYLAHLYPNTLHNPNDLGVRFRSGGGATGVLRPGESGTLDYDFIASGPSGTRVAVTFAYGLDGGLIGPNIRHARAWIELPRCAKGSGLSSDAESSGRAKSDPSQSSTEAPRN